MIPSANLRSPSGHRIFVRFLEGLAPKVAKGTGDSANDAPTRDAETGRVEGALIHHAFLLTAESGPVKR